MGSAQTVLGRHNYTVEAEQENGLLAKTQQGDLCLIKRINVSEDMDMQSVLRSLIDLQHPHINRLKEVFQGKDQIYVVLDYCGGGNLSQKIKEYNDGKKQFSEGQVRDWFLKICMALKYLHSLDVLHRQLQPKNILFTACGTICLGEFGVLNEKSNTAQNRNNASLNYSAPEILKGKSYDKKSEIWSLGCVLYELCTGKCAFSANDQILAGDYEKVPDTFSENIRQLITHCLQTDPDLRPFVTDILAKPFVISSLSQQARATVEELSESIQKLRELADGLESVHFGATVGSLTGSVIGAAGGITSIVGLVLAPFTLGVSLIVTGIGVGVAVAGGATAGISNITNVVSQSSNRQHIKNIILEFQEKVNSVVVCIRHITEALEDIYQEIDLDTSEPFANGGKFATAGVRVSRGLAGIPELVRLVQVANIGKVVAQTARAVRVAEVATGIFSGFFVALDLFFIAMDAREIHNIRQARAVEALTSQNTDNSDTESMLQLVPESSTTETQFTPEVASETMKFVLKIRKTAAEMEMCVDDLKDIITYIPEIPDI